MTTYAQDPPAYYRPASLSGVSEDSKIIEKNWSLFRSHKSHAASQNSLESLKSQLADIYEECKIKNWDGYGANQITRSALDAALNLVYLLPEGLIEPDPVPEPSGNLGIEWINSNESRFLLVPLQDALIYAGKIGRNIIHGQVKVSNNELPKEIISNLVQYFSKK